MDFAKNKFRKKYFIVHIGSLLSNVFCFMFSGNSSLSKTWSSNYFHDQYGGDSSEEESSSNVNYYPTAQTGIEGKTLGDLV